MNVIDKYLDGKIKGKQVSYMLAIIGLIVLTTNGFRYINWSPIWKNFYIFLLVIMLIASFMKKNSFSDCNFSGTILLFILIPFLSIINSFFIYGQSIISSISAFFAINFTWLLYFILHIFRVKEGTLLKALLYVSIFVVILQVVQQFTYPFALFGVRSEDYLLEHNDTEKAEIRNGLYRFRVCGSYYSSIIFLTILLWIKKKFNYSLGLLWLILLSSIYLFLTRQVIAAMLLTIIISFFIDTTKMKTIYLLFAIILLFIFFSFSDYLFGNFMKMTFEEANEDNIRVLAFNYFWNDSIKSPFTFLFGYGIPGSSGSFRNLAEMLSNNFHFHDTDVGFVGMIWRFGFLYVILSYYLLYRLFKKFNNKIPTYIKLFVVYVSLMSIMIFPFGTHASEVIVWPILLYICDLHINNSKLALKTT